MKELAHRNAFHKHEKRRVDCSHPKSQTAPLKSECGAENQEGSAQPIASDSFAGRAQDEIAQAPSKAPSRHRLSGALNPFVQIYSVLKPLRSTAVTLRNLLR